ncbi:hypothetical protein FQR65_LT20547 [Abscondita terminalis]|nr:hypothetical protein FQR65_LT20547 [Abscondita terminalis]
MPGERRRLRSRHLQDRVAQAAIMVVHAPITRSTPLKISPDSAQGALFFAQTCENVRDWLGLPICACSGCQQGLMAGRWHAVSASKLENPSPRPRTRAANCAQLRAENIGGMFQVDDKHQDFLGASASSSLLPSLSDIRDIGADGGTELVQGLVESAAPRELARSLVARIAQGDAEALAERCRRCARASRAAFDQATLAVASPAWSR